jgi:hypothetical protein
MDLRKFKVLQQDNERLQAQVQKQKEVIERLTQALEILRPSFRGYSIKQEKLFESTLLTAKEQI